MSYNNKEDGKASFRCDSISRKPQIFKKLEFETAT